MRIRTQTIIAAVAAGAIVIAAAATLLVFERYTTRAIERSHFANRVVSDGVSGLRLVTMEFVLYQQPRAHAQWKARHGTLGRMLASDLFAGTAEQAILELIRQRHQYAGETFARLTALHDSHEKRAGMLPDHEENEARLVTQIMLATQDIVVDAARLSNRSHEDLVDQRRAASAAILVLFALSGGLVLAGTVAALRGVVSPLRRLAEGAMAVGAGDLAFRTAIPARNEIGELSSAFDRMAGNLAAARDALDRRSLQLEEANRELEAFSYSVSHDLRAPLRGIDGWSLALLEDFGDSLDAKARGYLSTVREEAQRMGNLIDDLLKLSRVGRTELSREPVDLSAIARSAAARVAAASPERRFDFEIQPGLTALSDTNLLEIALANLFDNAAKFTRPRPVARIAFGTEMREDPETGVRHAAYFVRDNGVGFDMDRARNLFGAFQRMHKASEFPGTGIGLATVKRVVHRLGGQVRAEAQVDRGAVFWFTLEEAN